MKVSMLSSMPAAFWAAEPTTAICPSAYTELPPAILRFSMTRTAAPALAAS